MYEILTVRFCSRLGRSRASRSGLRCAAWMEDVDRIGQVVWRAARELPEVCVVYRKVFGGADRVDWSRTWTGEHGEKVE